MRPLKLILSVLGVVVFLALGVQYAAAQANTGSISGTVHDSTGAVVPDAKVSVRNAATTVERSVQTDSTGGYNLPALAVGTYDLTISKSGFADYKARVEVTVGGFVTVSPTLTLSTVTSTVEVVVVGGAAEVNTQSQEVSQLITPQQIQSLPSLTRNPYDFVALAGNVSGGDRSMATNNPQLGEGGGQNLTSYRGVGYNINGQRGTGTEVLLDGAENLNIFDDTIALLTPQDSVQEYRIITNNFDAQYGRAAGGIVNVTTKAGTSSFHGDAWEFNRLSAYTANTASLNAQGVPKGHYTRNQFGGDAGGPIMKDKLYFYASVEDVRVRSTSNNLAYVPTPQFLADAPTNVQNWFTAYGNTSFNFLSTVPKTTKTVSLCADFTAPSGGVCDDSSTPTPQPVPFVGTTAGNPANKCGVATPCPFSTIPDGTPIFGLVNYTAPADAGGDLPQNTYNLVGRLDYNLNENTQMFLRYGRESLVALPGSIFASPYPQYLVGQTIYNNNFLYALNRTFSSSLLSSTKLSFFRDDEAQNFDPKLLQTPTLFLDTQNSGAEFVNGQPAQLPGFFDFNTGTGGLPFGGPQNTIQFNEDLSWSRGRHNMKYGGQYNYIQLNRGYGAYEQAVEALGKSKVANGLDNWVTGTVYEVTKAINPAGVFPCQVQAYTPGGKGENPVITPSCSLTYPVTDPNFYRSDRYKDWAFYAEDSWRLTPKFTFNFGVRYEHFGVQHNNNQGLDSNFYYGSGSSFYQQVANGGVQLAQKGPIGRLWNPSWGTVGPRVGFAYDVFGNGKTALRGGYGISYERNFGNVTFNIVQNVPNNATVNIFSQPLQVANLGPFGGSSCPPAPQGCALPPVSPRDIDQNIRVAQTQFWGLTLERKLGSKAVLAFEYNGARGLHLYDIKNINPVGGGQVYLGQPLFQCASGDTVCQGLNPDCVSSGCLTRPNGAYTSINNRGNGGFSHYNGLNVHFQTEELGRTGLFVVSNYTISHALDNLSTTFSETSNEFNLGYLDPTHPRLDYGSADFDVRQRLATELTWTEPYFKGSHGALKQVASGWSLSPIFTARTGIPFSVWDDTNNIFFTPRYVPTSPVGPTKVGSAAVAGPNLYNLLTLPAANSFNNATLGISDFGPFPSNMTTRNEFRGPGAWSFDLAVGKTFPITERTSLEFRAEAFDVLNHANMYLVGSTADAVNFAAGSPVVIQGEKGGLGVGNAEGVSHDERRFGQFALRLHF